MAVLLLAPQAALAFDYKTIKQGRLTGKVTIQWLEPDVFLFIPDDKNPLIFHRADGSTIKPGRMLTDGGSIPRPMWAFRSYSPWGYAPAFIVHDWLFHMKNCGLPGYQGYSLESSAEVMAEVMKTMMESGKADRDPLTVSLMHQAVTSPVAGSAWERGRCVIAPAAFTSAPLAEYTLEFADPQDQD